MQTRPQAYAYALPRRGSGVDRNRWTSRIAQLEQELETTREGLRNAIRDLAIANAGQRTIREEARSANRELDRSKEELQSLQVVAANVSALRQTSALQVASLTTRQRQILGLVIAGHPSKNIAADLGISQRTVDSHRAAIMRKTGSKSLSALIRTALAAA
jgi:DNA-binding CsgD family transcriptional regulator